MKRREVLKYTAMLTGASLAAPLALSLSSCKSDGISRVNYDPEFFSDEEFSFIEKFVDVIIPKTDSPSATDVGVHQVIDEMVGKVYPEPYQNDYYQNFKALHAHLLSQGEWNDKSILALETRANDNITAGYGALKQQTVAYYLSTEEVGTKFLNYLPVPGAYEGCIDLSEVGGKAWAI